MVGKKAITRFLAEDFRRLFVRDVAVTFHGLHADGERVIVEETMTATLTNGNHYTNDYCFVAVQPRRSHRPHHPGRVPRQGLRLRSRRGHLQPVPTGHGRPCPVPAPAAKAHPWPS